MVRFSSLYATCALLLAATFAQGGPLASTTTTTAGLTTLTLTRTSRTTTTKRSPILTLTKPSTTTLAKVSTKIRTSTRTSTLVLSKTSTQTSVRTLTVRSTTTKASPVVTLTQPSTSTKTQSSRTTITATSTRTLHETSSSTITRDRKSTVYLDGTVTVQASVITVTSLVTSLPSAPTGSSGSGSGSASGSSGTGSDSSGNGSSGSDSGSGSGSGISSIPAGALPAGSYYATGDCGGTYADFQYLELDRYDFLYRATLEECTATAYDAQHAYATVILLYGRGCFVSGPFEISAGDQLPSDSFLRIWDRACFDDPNSTTGSQSGSGGDSNYGSGSSSSGSDSSISGSESSSGADSGSTGGSGDNSASSSGSSDGSASGPPTVPARALQEGTYHRTGACGLDFADYEHMRLVEWDYIPAISMEECATTAQDDMHSYAQMIAIHPHGCFIVGSFDITEGELLPTDIFMPVYDMSCFGVAPTVVPDTSLQPGTYTSMGGCGPQLVDWTNLRLNRYAYRPKITLEECSATAQDGNHDWATMIIPISEGVCFIVDSFEITEDAQLPSDEFYPVYDLSCVTPTPVLRPGTYTSTDSCGQKLVDLQYTDFHQAASIHNVANVKACKAAAHSGKYNWATMILYWPDNHSCFLLDGFDVTESTLFSSDQLLPLYDVNCPL